MITSQVHIRPLLCVEKISCFLCLWLTYSNLSYPRGFRLRSAVDRVPLGHTRTHLLRIDSTLAAQK